MPADVSCLILARNEEKMLPGLLDAVAPYVKEIIVVDGCSKDRTREIAYRGGANVFVKKPKGYPEADRAYGVSKCESGWVLLLDADERPSTFLLDHLSDLTDTSDGILADAYWIPRRNYYDVRHSKRTMGYKVPDLQLRLFRKSALKSPGGVHEHLAVDGKVEELQEPLFLIHLTPGVYDLRKPHNKWIKQNIESTPSKGFIYHVVRAPLSALYFAFNAVKQGAWRDGWTGAKAVLLLARYRFLVHLGLALKRRSPE